MKQILTFYFLAIAFFLPSSLFAQHPECGFDELHKMKMEQDPEYKLRTELTNKTTYDIMKSLPGSFQNPPSDNQKNPPVYTIPVVVHVMHLAADPLGTGSNISDTQIQDGLDHLNDAFRNINAYAGGPFYTNAGIPSSDVEIEFCLAVRDPFGSPTTGINRVATTYSNIDRDDPCTPPSGTDTQDDCMKALSYWNSTDYMNVWLVNEICVNAGVSCGVAGYAFLASAHGQPYDGVVNEASFWGSSTNNSKVHIHEVGHYLNLYHTFKDGCTETDCLLGGDRVCDTPPDDSQASVSCASMNTANTCSNDATITNSPFVSDVQDIYEDYMDYGFQSCQNTFTPNQTTRMRTALTTTRASLLSSLGCTTAAPPVSNFTSDFNSGCPGVSVSFQDISTNGTSSWSWTFPGGTPAASTLQNPTVVYNSPGTYDVTLVATNGAGTGSTETKTDYITIYTDPVSLCAISASNGNTTGNLFAFGIYNVVLETISNATGGTVSQGAIYLDYACTNVAVLNPGTSYNLSVLTGPVNSEDVRAYIDYNNDGVFTTPGEEIFSADNLLNTLTTQSFTTDPFPVTNTLLTLRVVSDFASSPTPTPCLTPTYGQVEDYAVYFDAGALPVELVSLEGEQENKNIRLSWQTATEVDNDFFTLEHSLDGNSFEYLTHINGNGNKLAPSDYRFVHDNPTVGTNYYRLSQTDFDGSTKVVGTVAVNFKPYFVEVTVQPNPLKEEVLNINYFSPQNSLVIIEIIDLNGKIVLEKNIQVNEGFNNFHYSTQNWSPGIYLLRTKQNNEIHTSKIVKIE